MVKTFVTNDARNLCQWKTLKTTPSQTMHLFWDRVQVPHPAFLITLLKVSYDAFVLCMLLFLHPGIEYIRY